MVKALEENKVATVSAEITMIPQNYVKVKEESDRIQLQRILDILDEDDDVQNVYHNWDDEE